ncbi:MAG: hypothetical protein NT047_03665 [Deltaproteobacteria bacterium]|nr:hypothetical protein [Deltaproteobacteria bacterium]
MEELQKPPPKRFGDFAKDHVPLDGSKLKIADILNKEIMITGYRVKNSKYNATSCLTIQFMMGDEKHVAFTGSQVLLDQCKSYEAEIPFIATVKRIDRYYSFT